MTVRELNRVLSMPETPASGALYVEKTDDKGVRMMVKSDVSDKISVFGRSVWLEGKANIGYTGDPQEGYLQYQYKIRNFDSFRTYQISVDQPSGLAANQRFSLVGDTIYLKSPSPAECPGGKIYLTIDDEVTVINVAILTTNGPVIVYPQEGYSAGVPTTATFYLSDYYSGVGDTLTTDTVKIELLIYSDAGLTQLVNTFTSSEVNHVAVTGLVYNKQYWARARYKGQLTGWTDWSPTLPFVTVIDPYLYAEKAKIVQNLYTNYTADSFGSPVVISKNGAYMAVSATGYDLRGTNSGAVFVYKRVNDDWVFLQSIYPTVSAGSAFGTSIAFSEDGTKLAIGWPGSSSLTGRVRVYYLSDNIFSFPLVLTSSTAPANDFLGISLAFNGDGTRLCVGAKMSSQSNTGRVYVFEYNGSAWIETSYITSNDLNSYDYFGSAIQMSSDGLRLLVSAEGDAEKGANAGAVYYFKWDGYTYEQWEKILPAELEASDFFGGSIAINPACDTLIATARGDADDGAYAGASYVYLRTGDTWTRQAKLKPNGAVPYAYFGISASCTIDGNTVCIGAFNDKVNNIATGTAHIFTRNSTVWTEYQEILASETLANNRFGVSTTISGDGKYVVIGATGNNQQGTDGGAVYCFVK